MRDASKDLRIGIATELYGITVLDDLGVVHDVPVYDGVAPVNGTFPRIIIMSASGPGGSSRFSKCGFGGQWVVTLKISMFYQGDVTKNLVDDISNEILPRLAPMLPPYIDIGPYFKVWNVDVSPANHLHYSDQVGNYVDKNITINFSITQL